MGRHLLWYGIVCTSPYLCDDEATTKDTPTSFDLTWLEPDGRVEWGGVERLPFVHYQFSSNTPTYSLPNQINAARIRY
jgi:hypothetical protein